jgi:hypothetical protein
MGSVTRGATGLVRWARMGSARKATAVAHIETAREVLMSNSFEFLLSKIVIRP